jgi:hypothetical protein
LQILKKLTVAHDQRERTSTVRVASRTPFTDKRRGKLAGRASNTLSEARLDRIGEYKSAIWLTVEAIP